MPPLPRAPRSPRCASPSQKILKAPLLNFPSPPETVILYLRVLLPIRLFWQALFFCFLAFPFLVTTPPSPPIRHITPLYLPGLSRIRAWGSLGGLFQTSLRGVRSLAHGSNLPPAWLDWACASTAALFAVLFTLRSAPSPASP